MESNPLITIVVAVFNGEKTLERCINSVIQQTYPYKELIIMDGGSTDGSVELLKRFDSNIKYWESKPDRGIYHAWNKALDHAEGEWICFIGCDDFFIDSYVLSKIVLELIEASNEGYLYAYGKVALYSDKNNRIVEYCNDPWEITKKRIKQGFFWVHSGSFHHKNLFSKNSRFDERFKINGDRDFLFRKLKDKEAYFIDDITIGMSMSGLSYNISDKKIIIDEALTIWKEIPMTTFPWLIYSSLIKLKCYIFIKTIFGERFSLKLADILRRIRGLNPYWDQ